MSMTEWKHPSNIRFTLNTDLVLLHLAVWLFDSSELSTIYNISWIWETQKPMKMMEVETYTFY